MFSAVKQRRITCNFWLDLALARQCDFPLDEFHAVPTAYYTPSIDTVMTDDTKHEEISH